jgi:hypothetical protein
VDLCPRLGGTATVTAATPKKTSSTSVTVACGDAMASAYPAYTPQPDATPEAELTALAAVYGFVLECQARKRAAERSGQDDAKETNYDRARSILPE